MSTILVVDDSIAVRKVAERLLTEAGLGVVLAASGEEALIYLGKNRPDVIVSDVIMPDKSGYEVCAFIRSHSTLSSIPVLLISGIVNDEVTKQAESCRADGVLKKPFQGTSLKDRVLELLSRRQEAPAPPVSHTNSEQMRRLASEGTESHELAGQAAAKLKEVEGQLREERARAEELARCMVDATEQIKRAKGFETQVAMERQRVSELESKIATLERQAGKVQELESALQSEQATVLELRQDAALTQKASLRVEELESALKAERAAADQLVQQLAELEKNADKMKDVESRCAMEEQRAREFQQKTADLETALSAERQKVADTTRQLEDMQGAESGMKELEALLATERDRNAVLARQAAEAERTAGNATKRLEDMARKLSEIAGLASQLGSGKGP